MSLLLKKQTTKRLNLSPDYSAESECGNILTYILKCALNVSVKIPGLLKQLMEAVYVW